LAGRARARAGALLEEDLVQEGLTRLLSSYGEADLRARSHDQLMSLAFRTMKNLVIDTARKKSEYLEAGKKDKNQRPGREPKSQAPNPEIELGRARAVSAVRQQVAGLAPEERCFLETVLATDSVPAAQSHCGWPPKSPYYVLRKLMARLRGELAHLEGSR